VTAAARSTASLPHVLVEAFGAAVERIVSVVLGKLKDFAIEGELRMADTISVAADDGPK